MSPPEETLNDAPELPLQFSVRTLLVAQAVCGVFLGLLMIWGIFALVLAFAATLVYIQIPARPSHARLKRLVIDLLGGAVLPVLCVIYDPVVFRSNGSVQVFAYVAIAYHITVLLTWLATSRWLGWWRDVAAGSLFVGALFALMIGLLLLPLALIGLTVLIGLLGFAPFLTSYVFMSHASPLLRYAPGLFGKRMGTWRFWLGAVLAVLIPAVVYFALGDLISQAVRAVSPPTPFPSLPLD